MENSLPVLVEQIISPQGRRVILEGLKNGFILLAHVVNALSTSASTPGRLSTSMGVLTAFLKERDVTTPLKAPDSSLKPTPVTPTLPRVTARPRRLRVKSIRSKPKSSPKSLNGITEIVTVTRDDYDSLALYTREAAELPLLTRAEEIELAAEIKKGNAQARDRMIRANLRLVIRIARGYENFGLPLLDLINEGNVGLMKAVDRFDPNKGAKLSTYAGWWIKQCIKRALADQSRTIRLPVHQVDKLFKMRKIEGKLREITGHDPTDEELADEMNIGVEKLRDLRESAIQPTSMEAELGGHEGLRLENIIKDENAVDGYDEVKRKNDHERVYRHLTSLNTRELQILTNRFGLDGADPQTLEVVGERFKVSRERIRQIQRDALKKLRMKMGKEERF